jgi:hypothetical protein
MRDHHCFAFAVATILISASTVCAQSNPGIFGVGMTVNGSDPGFVFSINVLPTLAIEPTFSMVLLNNDGHNQRQFMPGIGLLYQFLPESDLRPLVGARVRLSILRSDVLYYDSYYDTYRYGPRNTYTDVSVGPVFGARYYFSDNLAVSGEFQVTATFFDKGDYPWAYRNIGELTVSTSQLLAAYFYF